MRKRPKPKSPMKSFNALEEEIREEFFPEPLPPEPLRKSPTRWTHTGLNKLGKYGIVWREVEIDLLAMYRALREKGQEFPLKDGTGVRRKIRAYLMHLIYDGCMERKDLAEMWGVSARTVSQVLDKYRVKISNALDRIDWKARCAGYKSFLNADRLYRGTTKDLAVKLGVKPKAIQWIRKQIYA